MGSTDMPGPKVPRMMTFKEFLNAQEDDIDDVEAVRRFQEYKTEFKRTALSDFFVLHKEEEWYVMLLSVLSTLIHLPQSFCFALERAW